MSRPFQGVINIDIRDSVPDWSPYLQPVAPEGAPNVVYIVLDDTGFSAMEPWGGLIETPNINRLARNGLTYTNWPYPVRVRHDRRGAGRARVEHLHARQVVPMPLRRDEPPVTADYAGTNPCAFTGGAIRKGDYRRLR